MAEFSLKHKSLSVNIIAILPCTAPNIALFQLNIVLQATICYMGILYAVVIAHCILHRILVETQNLSVNIIAILPCTALYLHPQSSLHIAYCTEFSLKHKSFTVNIIAILPCTALYLHPT